MTRRVNIICQLLALAGVMLVPAWDVSPETKNTAYVLICFWQLAVGLIAHQFTPDGDGIK